MSVIERPEPRLSALGELIQKFIERPKLWGITWGLFVATSVSIINVAISGKPIRGMNLVAVAAIGLISMVSAYVSASQALR